MFFNRGCTQLGKAVSAMVDLAVEISFVDDSVKHICSVPVFSSFSRISSYSDLVALLRSTFVFEEDLEVFDAGFTAENVVTPLYDGDPIAKCELRMVTGKSSEPVWYSAKFLRVEQGGEFNGRVVLILSDISHHKEVEDRAAQLSKWVERDPLTGLYNKKAAQTLIDAYLGGEGKNSSHTMLFCDLDDFKSVNDTLGHPFGDALLSNVAGKFAQTFRREDIICRIGGDEFVILMKNASGRSYVSHRADILLERMKQAFDLGDHRVSVTMSVGIASYPECGTTYAELLHNADKAMYVSKFNGKNQYCFYDDALSGKNGTTVTPVDEPEPSEARTPGKARGRLSEYIFNCLYESTDIEKTISLVLQLMGTHFELGRVAIAEFKDDVMHITRQWTANGIKKLERPIDYSGELRALFESSRSCELMTMRYDNFELAPSDVRRKLIDAGVDDVHAFLHCPLLDDGVIRGYIVFFDCSAPRQWSEEERDTLSYVARLISLFEFKQQAHRRTSGALQTLKQALDGSPLSLFVIDPDSYELLRISDRIKAELPHAQNGVPCHKAFFGFDTPCEFCAVELWKKQGSEKMYVHEKYIDSLKEWLIVSASCITLEDGRQGCLCGHVYTTQYKDRENELEAENAMLRARIAELSAQENINDGGSR